MKGDRKKIGLIFAGSTVVSIKSNRSIYFIETETDIAQWIGELPELSLIANIQPEFILGENDSFSTDSIGRIAKVIQKREQELDGFVVLVRAENIIRAASACEFMLQGFSKPIVFTGSRYSPEAVAQQDLRKIIKMGGLALRSNLINAVQIASSDNFPVTAIMFGNKVIKPTKAVQQPLYSINLFRSFDDTYLGKVDFGITLYRNLIAPLERKYSEDISSDISVFDSDFLYSAAGRILLKTKKPFTGPAIIHIRENEIISHEQIDFLNKFFSTVCAVNEYFVLEQPGSIVPLARLTWPAAIAKAQWAHAQSPSPDGFAALMTRNAVGEFLPQ